MVTGGASGAATRRRGGSAASGAAAAVRLTAMDHVVGREISRDGVLWSINIDGRQITTASSWGSDSVASSSHQRIPVSGAAGRAKLRRQQRWAQRWYGGVAKQ
ncbi:hypothetical protein NL676_010832 [Syzygium grande]|nr:hypothetical protein NL676_010832 [Syzygium grande]